jgi:hypothetical protein
MGLLLGPKKMNANCEKKTLNWETLSRGSTVLEIPAHGNKVLDIRNKETSFDDSQFTENQPMPRESKQDPQADHLEM